MYGLINRHHLTDAIKEVCECLGNGANSNAHKLLYETCGAETLHGNNEDKSLYAGMGITQFDKIPFQDVKDRTRSYDKVKINNYFNIDIDLIDWKDLRYNPLLAMIFTRLKYKLIPDTIPESIALRAYYWKKHYNSELGKGTIEHYIEANSE